MSKQQQEDESIVGTFLKRLMAFAGGGYAFDSDHELREGTQREAFDGYAKGLAEGHTHGYFEIPTGVGKTALFISLIKNYLAAANGADDAKRVLIAVPSTDLVVQTAKAFAKFMPEIAPTIETDDDQGKEIDWEHSDVGVQYGGMKHAGKKPKVLITTYQSLCQDKSNKTYPPSEYGFVVYDEGHNTTAPKFGQAVGKFKDAIQLAVTATPDYSDDKTVAKLLPHRYYHLPLDVAIERGDLCPVDPILVKTNYTIDEKKFKEFLKQQQGRPFSRKQYESLLNQEARNLAAIKTYLLGRDANTGERYLGDTGMIFAGGVQHCNDLVRQMERLINSPDYRPVKEWLEKEGVALAAPIHNGIKTVELTIDGKKGTYTKDQVKDLHRKGKVLLLVSDKELKEGTDFPRDSIIMELVDRLSVVDATQRYGRGFRLDLPDAANDNPEGNPYKRCRVFNLVDTNTYSMYENQPQMLPIYCAEILGGAAFREPIKRKHLIKRYKNDVPDVHEKLEDSGFEVITDYERVKAVSKKYQQRKEELIAPPLEQDKRHWLTPGDMCHAIHISPTHASREALNAVYKAMLADETTTYSLPAVISGHPVETHHSKELIIFRSNVGKSTYFADPRIASIIHGKMNLDPMLPEEKQYWLSAGGVCEAIGLNKSAANILRVNTALQEILSDELSTYQLSDTKTNERPGSFKGSQLVQSYRDVGSRLYCDPRIVPIIERKLGLLPRLPEDKSHWLTGTYLCRALNMNHEPENYAVHERTIAKMAQDHDRVYIIEGDPPTRLSTSEVIGQYRGNENATWHINPLILSHFRKELGMAPVLPAEREHWLSATPICKVLSLAAGGLQISAVKQVLDELLSTNASYTINGINLKASEFIVRYSRKGIDHLFVDPEAIGKVITKEMVQAKVEVLDAKARKDQGLVPRIPSSKAHWLCGVTLCQRLKVNNSAENIEALNELLSDIAAHGGSVVIGENTLPVQEVVAHYSTRGRDHMYIDPNAVDVMLTRDMVLAKKAEIAARGEEGDAPQGRGDEGDGDAKGAAATASDDARAGLRKPRPSQPRRSEADMTDDERAAAKRGGRKRE